jgi:hypothetical protein
MLTNTPNAIVLIITTINTNLALLLGSSLEYREGKSERSFERAEEKGRREEDVRGEKGKNEAVGEERGGRKKGVRD